MTETRPVLQLGHSPDPDDAFMWWPLFELDGAAPSIDTGRFRYAPVAADIESLNRRSAAADLEITAMSCAQYPHVSDRYAITACGASMGLDYGPKLVARDPIGLDDLGRDDVVVAIPGVRTSAFATLCMIAGGVDAFRHEPVEFDRIIDLVADGSYAAGLVIHEGQLTFEEAGLHLIVDVGHWWHERHGLPLPLGLNTVRRDLDDLHGPGTVVEVADTLRRSLAYALEHRQASIDYALGFARDMTAGQADEFVGLYVNDWTVDMGETGRHAVVEFLTEMHRAGLTALPGPIALI